MSSWTSKQGKFCVEAYILNNSIIATPRAFRKQFKLKRCDPVPSPKTLRRWHENVRTNGITNNGEQGRPKPGWSKSVSKEETVERVREALIVSSVRSGWKHAASLQIKHTSWQRIVKNDLNMQPFKIQITQQVKDDNYPQRFLFCEKMLTMVALDNFDVGCIWFSDEAHFDLFGNANKQNFCYYSDSQPCQTLETPSLSACNGMVCNLSDWNHWAIFFPRMMVRMSRSTRSVIWISPLSRKNLPWVEFCVIILLHEWVDRGQMHQL